MSAESGWSHPTAVGSLHAKDAGTTGMRCLSPDGLVPAQDYMSSSDTSSTLASGNFLGIINVLMQLRKVRLLQGSTPCRPQHRCTDQQPNSSEQRAHLARHSMMPLV